MQNYVTLFNQLNAKGENITWTFSSNRPNHLLVYPGSQAMFELLPQSYVVFDDEQQELMDKDPKYDVWTNKAVALVINLDNHELKTDLLTILRLKREHFK